MKILEIIEIEKEGVQGGKERGREVNTRKGKRRDKKKNTKEQLLPRGEVLKKENNLYVNQKKQQRKLLNIENVRKLKEKDLDDALNLTGVTNLKYRNIKSLSGGEFQRVLIARAIAKKPEFLVLDEPVQGVDFKGEIALYELIRLISENLKCGILLISHDLHVVMSATDYVVCLNGHICCSGTPKTVANNHNYKELFGDRASNTLSIYEHKHDHTHSADGTIKTKKI